MAAPGQSAAGSGSLVQRCGARVLVVAETIAIHCASGAVVIRPAIGKPDNVLEVQGETRSTSRGTR
jgi:hypothetical protein